MTISTRVVLCESLGNRLILKVFTSRSNLILFYLNTLQVKIEIQLFSRIFNMVPAL